MVKLQFALLFLGVGMSYIIFGTNEANASPEWRFPWDKCTSMDQIVGEKCDVKYYVCDFGDTWFTREVLCNNCVGDCPPGRVFDKRTEICVWPSTIGCGCFVDGQLLGTKCEAKYYTCSKLTDGDWTTVENSCSPGTVYNPETQACQFPEEINC